MTCTHYLNIKLIFSEGTEKLGYSQTLSIVLKGSLTKGVGGSPVTFFSVHAKWGENRAQVVLINEMVITIIVFLDVIHCPVFI